MKDFGQWFADAGNAPAPIKPLEETMLPDGVFQRTNGKYEAQCRSCERYYEICWDWQAEGFGSDMSYCGGSPSCLP